MVLRPAARWSATGEFVADGGQSVVQRGVEREHLVEMRQLDRPAGRGAVRNHRETTRWGELTVGGRQDLQPDRGEERDVAHVDDQGPRFLRNELVGYIFERRSGRQVHHTTHREYRDVS